MKVRLGTVEVDDTTRRAIRNYFGEKGLATREEVRSFFISLAQADLETIVSDFEESASEVLDR